MFMSPFLILIEFKPIKFRSSGQQVLSMPSSNSLEYSSYKNVRSLSTFTCYLTGALSAFAPYLLDKKAQKIKKTFDLEKKPYKFVRTVFDAKDRS
jgi:hypothetical protein